MKRRNQLALTTRIMLRKQARIQRRMRHIASAATRDAHFGKELGAAFEQRNLAVSAGPRRGNCRNKTGRASTRNDNSSHFALYGKTKAHSQANVRPRPENARLPMFL